jgi:hypothetical protein
MSTFNKKTTDAVMTSGHIITFTEDEVVFSKTCTISGKKYMTIVPRDLFDKWQICGENIQDVFHMFSSEQREFILSGITPKEWDYMFPEFLEEEEDDE